MIKAAIEYLTNLGKPEILSVNDLPYSTKNINLVTHPTPRSLELSTLEGLGDYLRSGIDEEFRPDRLLVHVCSPSSVVVYAGLNIDATRDKYIVVQAELPHISFGQFMDLEKFNIMLQSCFVQSEERAKVLAVTGNVKEEAVQNIGDDGVSQAVTAKAGIATVAKVSVPNPVVLAPFRSFTDIEQVPSEFVLRMKSGNGSPPEAALFEADGGAWRVEATKRVKEYLKQCLCDLPNIHVVS